MERLLKSEESCYFLKMLKDGRFAGELKIGKTERAGVSPDKKPPTLFGQLIAEHGYSDRSEGLDDLIIDIQ